MLEKIYKVSQVNAAARAVLEANFTHILIEGEISNLVQPSSGHIYFSLKDETAQIRAALFRNHMSALKFQPKNGAHVVVTAQVSLYETRGDYQLIVEHMELAGAGLLHEKFLQLKSKLEAEGLFALEHKKPLPKLPKCVGVVTSPTGAAIRDILSVLQRRFSSIPVIIYPTQVQGEAAAGQIVEALAIANARNECDVLILARGGGSLEDLWSFNEEIVARAIFASKIPIVSAVGHEIDFTIADFVADVRAPTPSAAAELVVPDSVELLATVAQFSRRLATLMQHKLQQYSWKLANLERFKSIMQEKLKHCRQEFVAASEALNLVSPLATLTRGYAIVTHNGKVISEAKKIQPGETIDARLVDGSLECVVKHFHNKSL